VRTARPPHGTDLNDLLKARPPSIEEGMR
jgi:hypothetical protein